VHAGRKLRVQCTPAVGCQKAGTRTDHRSSKRGVTPVTILACDQPGQGLQQSRVRLYNSAAKCLVTRRLASYHFSGFRRVSSIFFHRTLGGRRSPGFAEVTVLSLRYTQFVDSLPSWFTHCCPRARSCFASSWHRWSPCVKACSAWSVSVLF
jgi:hypothetical protein